MNKGRIDTIISLGAAVEYIDIVVQKELNNKPFLEYSTEDAESLYEFLHTEYLLSDLNFPAFWAQLDALKESGGDIQKEQAIQFAKEASRMKLLKRDDQYDLFIILKKYKYDLPMLCSYFLLYSIWSKQILAFFEQGNWKEFEYDLESDQNSDDIQVNDEQIQALWNALVQLGIGIEAELELTGEQSKSLDNSFRMRQEKISKYIKNTELCSRWWNEEEKIKNSEYDLDFVMNHQDSFPLTCIYMYMSDFLIDRIEKSSSVKK